MPNRREFLVGIFAGISVMSIGGTAHANVPENYVAPGKFNIWQIQNQRWGLLTNSLGNPLEFDDPSDAWDFAKQMNLQRYPDHPRTFQSSLEGLVHVRRAPSVVHDYSFMRLDDLAADALIMNIAAEVPVSRNAYQVLREILLSESGDQQSRIWTNGLNQSYVEELVELQTSPTAKRVIRSIFFQNQGLSVHNNWALMEAFRPSNL